MGGYYFFHDQRREFLPIRNGFTLGRIRGHITFSDDARISREHCRIHMIGDAVYIEDLGSTNRTTINRQEIDPFRRQLIRLNDVIRIGQQRLVLTCEKDTEPEIEDRTLPGVVQSRVIPIRRKPTTNRPSEGPPGRGQPIELAVGLPGPTHGWRPQRPRADWRREPPRAVRAPMPEHHTGSSHRILLLLLLSVALCGAANLFGFF